MYKDLNDRYVQSMRSIESMEETLRLMKNEMRNIKSRLDISLKYINELEEILNENDIEIPEKPESLR
jgi:RNase P subunit RPR2